VAAKVYDLAEIIEQERHDAAPLEIRFGKTVVKIDPPILWPDEVVLADYQTGATLLLGGDENYKAFCEAGGTPALLFQKIIPKHFGDLGESEASTD
jgi:hypothetical protein